MNDLDKLIGKMQREKASIVKPVEKPTEDKEKTEIKEKQEEKVIEKIEEKIEEEEEDLEEDEDIEEEEKIEEDKKVETPIETSKSVPATSTDAELIEQEVSLLQNSGVFRRELLMTLKELVDVHRINTQTLLDLKKEVTKEKK